MNVAFGQDAAVKATLNVEYSTGEKFVVNFDRVDSVDTEAEIQELHSWSGNMREYMPTGIMTLKIRGRAATQVVPAKPEKPAPTPKKPTVRASAERVRKTTVKQALTLKKIGETEKLLNELRMAKIAVDAELMAAREQLVASASL
jgi:hypothetical protein